MNFKYKDAQGEIKTFDLHQAWREEGKYIIGFDTADERTKTFLKYRVIEYLNGSEKLLEVPYPPAPEPLHAITRPPEILFTGFPKEQRAKLEAKAIAKGMHVVKTVTANLLYLCAGPNAGPAKLSAARSKGCYAMSPVSFLNLLETGELPDHDLFD